MAKGTAQQNVDYVSKSGKWKDNKKSETSADTALNYFLNFLNLTIRTTNQIQATS